MPPVFYDPNQAVRGLFAPLPRPILPPTAPPGQPQWWQQPRTEQEIHRQDLVEHGNQPLGVGRLESSDPNIDPGMNRLRPATEQRTGDTFMGVNPEEGEMQGDPSLRENIGFQQPQPQQDTGFQPDFLSRLWHGLNPVGSAEASEKKPGDPLLFPQKSVGVEGAVGGGGGGMGGPRGTTITRGSGPGAGWFPTTKAPYSVTQGGVPSVRNVTPLESDQFVRAAIDAKANRNLLPGTRPRSGEATPYDLALARQRHEKAIRDLLGLGSVPF